MFKQMSLKIYRKVTRFENSYGSSMADKMMFGRLWYKVFTHRLIQFLQKTRRTSRKNHILFDILPDFSGNAKALYDYMVEQGKIGKYKVTWIVSEPKDFKAFETKHTKFIKRYNKYTGFRTIKCYSSILKARYVFFSDRLSWINVKSKGQMYISVGDACCLLKELNDKSEQTKLDFCVVSNRLFEKDKQEFYSCSKNKIITIGNARCHQIFSNRSQAQAYFESLIGEHRDLKKILWIPQYRSPRLLVKYKSGIASMMGIPMLHSVSDLPKLNELCRENHIHLVIYCNQDSEVFCKEVGNVSHISFLTKLGERMADAEVYELFPKFDALISDYSAAALDFLLLDKPIGYVLEDYEEIQKADGFLVKDPMAYMPGEKIYSMDGLTGFMQKVSRGEDHYQQQRKEVCGRMHPLADDYCKRILEHFKIL